MSDVIEFRPPLEPEEPKIKSVSNRSKLPGYCEHTAQLLIDTDTQLVECSACHLVMSAYSALMKFCKEWDRMRWDVTEWRKMKAEQQKKAKETRVHRYIRQLQWIELPGEDEPVARQYWQKITEATGSEPYAMFRRGKNRGLQYCILSPTGGWTDADFAINSAKRKLQVVKES